LCMGRQKKGLTNPSILQPISSIFVFATCGGYKGATTILVSCKGLVNRTVTAAFAYPFRLNQVTFSSPDPTRCNGTWSEFHLVGNFSSSAQFFVTLAVLMFLYCIVALVLYLGYMHIYRSGGIFPIIDYVFTLGAVFLWLVSSAAWAKALVDIKVSTGPRIVEEIPACKLSGSSCVFASVTSMGSLNVSVVCILTPECSSTDLFVLFHPATEAVLLTTTEVWLTALGSRTWGKRSCNA
uniref:Synaptophysin like 1 n=1 Tax=Varanus komodoensis TaxID=61221 RepID=A0A8D2LWJ8_VARKO